MMDAAFHHLKAWICQTLLNITLAYYDQSKLVIVQMIASKNGLGAALLQSSWPMTFTSKTLTDVETHYANTERQCLSVCFSLEMFHTYLYGKHVFVQNDHKPLKMIHQKSIYTGPPNLQHMLLHMQKYDYTIQYKPNKEMVLADCLSCFPSLSESLPIPIHQNIQHVLLSTDKMDTI